MPVRAAPSDPPVRAAAPLAHTIDGATGPVAATPEPLVTQRLGRFIVLRVLGEGGMGKVFAAYDEQLDRRVAVKLLRQLEKEAGSHLQRVLREAQAMARVAHENVVHVYEVGQLDGQVFIAMEFIDGTTLTAWQQEKKRPWQELLAVYRQAALGLAAAHQTGLVHRDFKPDNVLVDRTGRARVVDFGLARMQGDATVSSEFIASSPQSALHSPLTRDGAIAGTPGYMSPEQARGAAVDARSDQFSFCVALYEALYGRAPFASRDMVDALSPGRPRPPPAGSAIPVEVFQALARGMATEPTARFPSVAALIEALAPSSAGEGAAAKTGRLFIASATFLLVVVSAALLVVKRSTNRVQLEELMALSVFMFVLVAATAFVSRRNLRTSALHSEMVVRFLCFAVTSVCIRGMGLFIHLDVKTFLPIDLAAAGGYAMTFAYPYLPLMWPVAAGFELAAAAAALWPEYCVVIANLSYTTLAFVACYSWARAARHPKAKPTAR